MIFDEKFKLWWPDFETDYAATRDYIVKRITDIDVVVRHVGTRGIAVQAGGHVGLFPRRLSQFFGYVFSFEAIPQTYNCMNLNLQNYSNVIMANAALGPSMGKQRFSTRSSGRSRADAAGDIEVTQVTIDSLNLPRCDLIYLDIEGGELDALEGAQETIKKFRPALALEVLKGNLDKTLEFTHKLHYSPAGSIHSDHIFIP